MQRAAKQAEEQEFRRLLFHNNKRRNIRVELNSRISRFDRPVKSTGGVLCEIFKVGGA